MLAHVPQILRIAGDQGGAIAVSCWRWALFALSHLTTLVYAVVVAEDLCMALMFGVSAVGCATIVVLTCVQASPGPSPRNTDALASGWCRFVEPVIAQLRPRTCSRCKQTPDGEQRQ